MKYSGACAQARISAAMLMNEVPQIADKLETGEINLSQLSNLQRAVNEAEKIHQLKVSTEVKSELIEQITNHTTSQTQQICAEALDIPVIQPQTISTQRDDSKVVSFTFSKEQFAKFEMLRDFLAHKNFQKKRTQQMQDVLETMFDELIKANDINFESKLEPDVTKEIADCVTEMVVRRVKLTPKQDVTSDVYLDNKTAGNEWPELNTHWKALTPKRKKIILKEDRCCQYTDYETGRTCRSTFNLHVDHIIPKHAGGPNDPGNLRVLCREHNLYREKMFVGVPDSLLP